MTDSNPLRIFLLESGITLAALPKNEASKHDHNDDEDYKGGTTAVNTILDCTADVKKTFQDINNEPSQS